MSLDIRAAFDAAARSYDGQRRQLIPCFDDFYGHVVALVAEAARPGARAGCFEVESRSDSPEKLNPSLINTLEGDSDIRAARGCADLMSSRSRILDLGAGTGLLSALVAQAVPSARFTLADLSEGMLAQARERFAASGLDVSYRVMDHLDLADEGAFDVVMSALSIHHLEDEGKRALYKAAARALAPGGLLVNADQVAGDTEAMEARYWRHWFEAVQASGLDRTEIDAAIARQSFDRRTPLAPQLAWLAEAGLSQVECRYKNVSFAVMCGVK